MTSWMIITMIQGVVFFAMGTRCGMKLTAKHCAKLTSIQLDTYMSYLEHKGLLFDFRHYLDSESRRLAKELAEVIRKRA